MKKYLLLLVCLVFISGCSLKQRVESHTNDTLKKYTPEEFATGLALASRQALPEEVNRVTKDKQEVKFIIKSATNIKHRLIIESEMKIKSKPTRKKYKTLEYYSNVGRSYFYRELCLDNSKARASINYGVDILVNLEIKDKNVPIFINKKLCDIYYPLK